MHSETKGRSTRIIRGKVNEMSFKDTILSNEEGNKIRNILIAMIRGEIPRAEAKWLLKQRWNCDLDVDLPAAEEILRRQSQTSQMACYESLFRSIELEDE